MLRPRIYGWRLAAGIVLWFCGALLVAAAGAIALGGALRPDLTLAAAAWIVLAASFWRGSQAARFLAVLPVGTLLLAGLVLGLLMFAGCSHAESGPALNPHLPLAHTCMSLGPNPFGLAALGVIVGAAAIVVAGIVLPGLRADEPSAGVPARLLSETGTSRSR